MFEKEAATLKPQERAKLLQILDRWVKEDAITVKNLLAEHFLPSQEMQYIVRKLVELPDNSTRGAIETELRKQFYSWLQLRGREVGRYAAAPQQIGIVIPLDLIKNLFLTQFGAFFVTDVRVDRFIDKLKNQPRPGQWLKGHQFGHLRIKSDQMLNWFFWESEGEIRNPRELFSTRSSSQARVMLGLPERPDCGNRLAVMVFNCPEETFTLYPGMQLHRPTWCDADFMSGFRPTHETETRFGIINPTYDTAINGKKRKLAEGIGRSAYFKLSFLESFDIFS